MAHPVCDFAHHMTKVALGGTGIFLSDGATNVMPIGPHRGDNLSYEQQKENREAVHHGWKTCYLHTMHSLVNGLYQGWDLNPAQLPMRYAATYSFFLSSFDDAAFRLKSFVDRAAISTLTGDIFDDAATGQGLLNFFLKALNCGGTSPSAPSPASWGPRGAARRGGGRPARRRAGRSRRRCRTSAAARPRPWSA
jgi:hypothetical protein